jgi:hypothetical protein
VALKDARCEDVDRLHLAQERDQWRAVVNTVMNLHIYVLAGCRVSALFSVRYVLSSRPLSKICLSFVWV